MVARRENTTKDTKDTKQRWCRCLQDLSVYQAPDTELEHRGVEVDQQSKTQAAEPQICQQLRLVDRLQPLHRFDLDDHTPIHEQIQPVRAVNRIS